VVHTYEWDCFISHASEDKQDFVEPLFRFLTDHGVNAWYDDFTLTLGDSLSRSIDAGLLRSQYGVIVVSKAFLSKNWPEYEFRGLVALENTGRAKRIVPIWHGVTKEEVMTYSPSLADKIAANTSAASIDEVGLRVIQVVRPDIFESLYRRAVFHEISAHAPKMRIPLENIMEGPIRHRTLPVDLLVRLHLIQKVFEEVLPLTVEQTVDNFQRDMHPDEQIHIWERMATAYLAITSARTFTIAEKRSVFSALLGKSMGESEDAELNLTDLDSNEIDRIWLDTIPKFGQ
jgi:hypothetical protein